MDIATIVGAYALRPPDEHEQPQFDRALLERDIDGLEIADQELAAPDLLRRRLGDMERSVVTLIPGTMRALSSDPGFGLASTVEDGRRAAVRMCQATARAVTELDQARGRRSVCAIQVHSAPRRDVASASALARSLDELGADGGMPARVVIEHCDTQQSGSAAEKGFLSLEEELRVAQDHGCLMSINWGRSAIEGRDPDLPLAHLRQVAEAGVLGGLVFSGAGGATLRSRPWEDAHLGHHDDEPASMLTSERIADCVGMAAAQATLLYLGVKITAPAMSTTLQRLAMLDRILDQVGATIADRLHHEVGPYPPIHNVSGGNA